MNYKNDQLIKIGLDVVKHCDDFFAIQKLAGACLEKLKYMSAPRQIGEIIENDQWYNTRQKQR